MTLIIAVIGALNLFVIRNFGKAKYVFAFIISWWFLWLMISTKSISGIFVPKDNTYLLYLLMLCSITSGGMLYVKFGAPNNGVISNIDDVQGINAFQFDKSRLQILYKLCYYFLLPITIFLLLRALKIFISLDSLEFYRLAAFGTEGETSILFTSDLLQMMYFLIVSPLSFSVFLTGGAFYFLYSERRLLILGSALIVMEAISMMGRFSIYTLILFLLILWIAKSIHAGSKLINIVRIKNIFVLIVLLVPLMSIGFIRSDSALNISDIFHTSIINYHTLGFSLFDDELNDPESRLNKFESYGRASLGIFERAFIIAMRRFDRSLESVTADNAGYLNEYRELGEDADGNGLFFNAFGTVLFPLYMDGGVLLVIIGPFVYGYFLAKKALQTFSTMPCAFDAAILMALIYLGLFSLFQPLIDTSYWLFLVYIYLFFNSNLRMRNETIQRLC